MAGDSASDGVVDERPLTLDDAEIDRVGQALARLAELRAKKMSLDVMVSIMTVEFPNPPVGERWTPDTVAAVLETVDAVQAECGPSPSPPTAATCIQRRPAVSTSSPADDEAEVSARSEAAPLNPEPVPDTIPEPEPTYPEPAEAEPIDETDLDVEVEVETDLDVEVEVETGLENASDVEADLELETDLEADVDADREPTFDVRSMVTVTGPSPSPDLRSTALRTDEPVDNASGDLDTGVYEETPFEEEADLTFYEDSFDFDGYAGSDQTEPQHSDHGYEPVGIDHDRMDPAEGTVQPDLTTGPQTRSLIGVGLMAMVGAALATAVGYGAYLLMTEGSADTAVVSLQGSESSEISADQTGADAGSSGAEADAGDVGEAAGSAGSGEPVDTEQPVATADPAEPAELVNAQTSETGAAVPPTERAWSIAPGDGTVVIEGAFPGEPEAERYVGNLATVFGAENIVANHGINPEVTLPPDTDVTVGHVEFFLPNTTQFDTRYLQLLQNVSEIVKTNAHITLRIEAAPGTVGALALNADVSERRFRAVEAYLLSLGVDGDQIAGAWAASDATAATTAVGGQQHQVELTLEQAAADPNGTGTG